MIFRTLLACCLLLIFGQTFAQNWYPALPGKTQFFAQGPGDTPDSTLHGFRTTFTGVSGTDSLYTFNRIFRRYFEYEYQVDCNGDSSQMALQYKIDRENVGGDGMIARSNGEFLFTGPPADTFAIQTQTPVGAKWLFQTGTSDSAWIVSRSQQNIMGVMDSVITINISTGKTILLSQNHGFLEWDYFYPLAFYVWGTTFDRGILYGIEETNFGRKFPRFSDIFALDPGDQFRYDGLSCGFMGCQERETYLRINSASITPSAATFNAEKSLVTITPVPYSGIDTQYYALSPTVLNYSAEPFFDLLPGESDGYWVMDPPVIVSNWNNRVRIPRVQLELLDTCAMYYSEFEHARIDAYADGLGLVSTNEIDVGYLYQEELICYNKISEIWNGPCDTLLNPVAIEQTLLTEIGIDIFPQPAGESCLIRAKQGNLPPGSLGIYTLEGTLVQNFVLGYQSALSMETNNLRSGMYILRLETEDGRRLSGKIVVQH